jgi:hypothetical protein
MSIIIPAESHYGKELWKWEHHTGEVHPSDPTIRGMRPREFQPYPAMMVKVTQKNPWQFEEVIVHSEMEQRNLESRGFVSGGRGEAAKAFDAAQQELAVQAAHRNWDDRHAGEKARAEIERVEQASSKHLGEIPATPIKKRGRPAKKAETPIT